MHCFGKRRGSWISLATATLLGMSLVATAKAGGLGFHSSLPGEVPAYDYSTGGQYFAPPVPYGHYAKDPHAAIAKGLGHVTGPIHGAAGHLKNKLGALHGHGGHGCGKGCGLGSGHGHGGLGSGCGLCSGLGGCKHGGAGIGSGLAGLCGDGGGCGLGKVKNFGPYHPTTAVVATSQAAPSGQAGAPGHVFVNPCGSTGCGPNGCGINGCGLGNKLHNLAAKLKCKFCGGRGCGGCGGAGIGDACSSCGGKGCGACGGCGLLTKHLGGLKGKLHGLLGGIAGPKYDYFVGAGGPVPLTPGYVPYIVTTRSPRDFFAFPPRTPDGF